MKSSQTAQGKLSPVAGSTTPHSGLAKSGVSADVKPEPISPYKTIETAAEYLGATPWAIAQAIRANELQAKKLGKRFVTTVQWLNEWFERLEDAA